MTMSEEKQFGIAGFLEVWREAVQQVLGQVSGSTVSAEALPPEEAGPALSGAAEQGRWFRFIVGAPIKGEIAFVASPAVAVLLAQILMAEPLDESGELNDDRKDATNELFRQFSGLVASALKSKLGTEIEVRLADNTRPPMPPAVHGGFRLTSPQFPEIVFPLQLGIDLTGSLQNWPAHKPKEKPGVTAAVKGPALPAGTPSPSAGADPNLDLLLDVMVEATLCFGEQTLPLRDVLELTSGAVVELNRHVNDPGELLVGGKLIARGDVVIVDGNYGLRITEIVSPQKRLAQIAL